MNVEMFAWTRSLPGLLVQDTIQTILTSEQKENVISLMSSFVFGP